MWSRAATSDVSAALAAAFLSDDTDGSWDRSALVERGALVFGRRPRWLPRVASSVLEAYRTRPADRPRELGRLVERTLRGLDERGALTVRPPAIVHRLFAEPAMGPRRWPVPEIDTLADLAGFLDLHLRELRWLADARGLERSAGDERLRNYRYAWLPRRQGPPRLIEQPKRLLKEVQRRVLHEVLDHVPPHEAAHGFRRGHSALTHARRHVGQTVVLRFDLEDFFPSVEASRVYGVFRSAGYPETVAYHLTALCTNVVPHVTWARAAAPSAEPGALAAHHRLGRRLATPHLPQGAPTSPALANLAALGLDRRLAGLARECGATYSRYVDDLALSGDRWLVAHAAEVRATVAAIVRAEGFRLNESKSGLTTRAGRQRLTGIVVNERPNVPRRDYDLLRATLHDAGRRGPGLANRAGVPDFRGHLLGRIAWVEAVNPGRRATLRKAFAQIAWEPPRPGDARSR